jgi:hypothetical protein
MTRNATHCALEFFEFFLQTNYPTNQLTNLYVRKPLDISGTYTKFHTMSMKTLCYNDQLTNLYRRGKMYKKIKIQKIRPAPNRV